jgi:hypothetical protein
LKRVANCRIDLEINKLVHVISLRESLNQPVLVLVNAANEIVGDAHVQYAAGTAGENVHVVLSHARSMPKRDGRDKPGHDDVVTYREHN